MFDVLNERLIREGKEPIRVRSLIVAKGFAEPAPCTFNGRRIPWHATTTCQPQRAFKDGDTIVVEPGGQKHFLSSRILS
jgi:succinate dehydrogenase / fumarate reductase iron-sulfur subunit